MRIRKSNIAIGAALLLSICTVNLHGQGEKLFDDSFLHEIRFVQLDTTLWDGSKVYQMVSMSIDGQNLDSIGIKEKGNISRNVPNLKIPLKIKTNKYVPGKKYDGIKEFTLHNNYQDPTMLREKLSYELCEKLGLYTLRTAFAKVYIDEKYWGLYTLVEGKDEMFKLRFDDRDADAIESLDFGTMCFISNDPEDYRFNKTGLPYYKLENGDETTAFERFVIMIDKANNTPDDNYVDEVSKYLNLPHFFRYQAVNVYLMNFDSYIGYNGNQIYMYDTIANIWQIIPWDFNGSMNLWDNGNGTQYANSYPLFPERITSGCIAGKLETISRLRKYYLEAMCELIYTYADTNTVFSRIDTLKDQISAAVYSDSRKMYTNQEFDLTTEYGSFTIDYNDFEGLKTFFSDRYKLIKQSLEDENFDCDNPNTSYIPGEALPVLVYPNPSTGIVNITGGVVIDHLDVFNVYGQRVASFENPYFPVDLTHLKAGMYLLRFTAKGISHKSTLIIH